MMRPSIKGESGSQILVIGEKEHVLPGPIEQSIVWEEKKCVVVLLQSLEMLLVFDWNGRLLRTFPPPEGFEFYYLATHDMSGISVVCVTNTPINGWRDWHFRVNLRKGELERFSPSK